MKLVNAIVSLSSLLVWQSIECGAYISSPVASSRSASVSRDGRSNTFVTSTTGNKFIVEGRSTSTPSALNSARIADTPEDDGGPVPTAFEKKEINSVKRKVLLPPTLIPGFVRSIIRYFRSKAGTNKVLFFVLDSLANGNPMQDIVEIDDDIDFSDEVQDVMWFQIKKQNESRKESIIRAYRLLQYAPPLLIAGDDAELMEEEDYDRLFGKYIDPHEDQMMVDSPEECFLANAPAFCAPLPDDPSISVCDLDYMKKYQVQKGTKNRYGGKAFVKDGKIIEVSGSKKGDTDFVTKKSIFLSAFAVHLVGIRHAVMGHLALYQKYLMSLTTKKSEEYKDEWTKYKSPELLMKVMTPRKTSEVNFNIQLLIGPANSLVGRACSFTNDGYTLMNLDKYEEYNAMSPIEIIKEVGSCGSKDWESACLDAWDAAQKVVNCICRDLDKSVDGVEQSLEELAMLMWTGTFYHGFIGDFQLRNVCRGNLPFLLTGKPHEQTKAYGTLSTTIGVSTMARTMDMNTVGKYLYTKEDRDAWAEYQQTLTTCAKKTGIPGFTYEGAVYNAIDF